MYVLYIPCRSIDEVTLKCQHDRMGFMHFDPFGSSISLHSSGSLKNDVLNSSITYKVASIYNATMSHNISDLPYLAEFTVKCPVIVCTQTRHETKSRGNKCIKETNSEWPA